ncbi:MAG: formylglycine-generating enzyme family protein [Candidatus Coatesbacteria bacterium]|nr:formylglycine-generating enzyme family protein [Candidatus Coatesbacteria bacterium]
MKPTIMCVVFFSILFVAEMAWSEPVVEITTDRTVYQSGDLIEVTLSVGNPGEDVTVDLCVGLLTSDGSIYTLGPSGWALAIVPWSADLRMPTQFDMCAHFYFGVPSILPSPPINEEGEYYVATLCLRPGTWNWASNLSMSQLTYTVGGSIPMNSIPAGSFLMGSPSTEEERDTDEGPQRTVHISEFMLSPTEITQKQWQDVMGWNDSHCNGDDNPVEMITWFDCLSFCNELSETDGYTKCYTITNAQYSGNRMTSADVTCDFEADGYRLPTEAEWEYACRAGTATRFHTGDSESDLALAGWYEGNSSNSTFAVGQKQSNAFGLYDMHGNVAEWCWDWHSSTYYSTRPDPDYDPVGPDTASGARVVRGGGYSETVSLCRSASRIPRNRGLFWEWVGFRVARSVD